MAPACHTSVQLCSRYTCSGSVSISPRCSPSVVNVSPEAGSAFAELFSYKQVIKPNRYHPPIPPSPPANTAILFFFSAAASEFTGDYSQTGFSPATVAAQGARPRRGLAPEVVFAFVTFRRGSRRRALKYTEIRASFNANFAPFCVKRNSTCRNSKFVESLATFECHR